MTYPGRLTMLTAVAVALLVAAAASHAKQTPEQKCRKGRYDAAAKYVACQQKSLAKWVAAAVPPMPPDKFEVPLSKCRVKYTDTWARLQKKAMGTGATCDNPRFNDNGDGTVTDRLTALQWQKTTNDGTVRDKDNTYSWSTSEDGDNDDADGTAFTTFLATLNSGECLAGQCDWRLPTIYELQTILLEPYACTTSPCIDQAVFGPTLTERYWTATTSADTPFAAAWTVGFYVGYLNRYNKNDVNWIRAVRGGL